MGFAYFIELDREDVDFDPFVNGKFIARDAEQLDVIAVRLGLRPLSDFAQVTADDFANFFGDEADAVDLPAEPTWYAPEELLSTVRGLVQHLKQNPSALKRSDQTLEDLTEYERVLTKAKAAAVRVRLGMDM
jgi:hypothetical protein